MRNIPQLSSHSTSKENIEEFKGLNKNERIAQGEWSNMENMSCDDYPVASTRNKRIVVPNNEKTTYEVNESKLTLSDNIGDVCEANGEIIMLKDAVLNENGAEIEGKVFVGESGKLFNVSKEKHILKNCRLSNLWWEFEKNYMFFSKYEICCEIAGRQYRCKPSSSDFVICAVVTTTENVDGISYTYPLIISENRDDVSFYYHNGYEWVYANINIPQSYEDEKGKIWYYNGNAAAMPDVDISTTTVTGHRAQYIGTFSNPEEAVKALVQIYYSHFAQYNKFWGYSPLIEYPCNKSNKDAWASAFNGIDANSANSSSRVYMSYGPDSYGSSFIPDFSLYFYEKGITESGYDLTVADTSSEWKSAMLKRAYEVLSERQKDWTKEVHGRLYLYNKSSKTYSWYFLGLQNGSACFNYNYGWNIYDRISFCFYTNSNKQEMYKARLTNPINLTWQLDSDGYIEPQLEYSTDYVFALIKCDTDVTSLGEITVENNNGSSTSLFGTDKGIKTNIKEYSNQTLLIDAKINPRFIYETQKDLDYSEDLEFYYTYNGYNIDNVKNSISIFDDAEKRTLISSGTSLISLPDGVIVNTESGESCRVAVKLEEEFGENTSDKLNICVMDGDVIVSCDETSNYRYVENVGIQKNTGQSSLEWTTIQTSVRLFTAEDWNKYFNVGDVVEVKPSNVSDDIFKVGLFNGNKQYLRIYKIGTIDGRYYVEFENTYAVGENFNHTFILTVERKFPNAKLGCESQNRIWLAQNEGHEIYASALGDPINFYDYSGYTTDSYAVNVGTSCKFTGVVNYLGTPLFFKENALHIVGGSMPSEYYVTTYTDFKGCEEGSERSFAIINNILYYYSPFGVVAYDGSSTTVISEALGRDVYKNGIAGALGNKYYISLYNMTSKKRELYCYDTTNGLWTKETDKVAVKFLPTKNELIYATNSQLYKITGGNNESENTETDFEWYAETGTYGYSYPNQKYISRLQVRMYLDRNAKARLLIQYNSDGIWHKCGTEIIGKGIQSFIFPIRPQRCDHMKLRIEGTGKVKIYSITKVLEIGGEY